MSSSSRYRPLVKIASGGMATVFLGTARGDLGFQKLVALKRPHQHLVDDPAFRRVLLAEARLASRVHHPHVVEVRDVEELEGFGLQLVMDYVEGAALGTLLVASSKGGPRLAPGVAVRVVLDACHGLHAAHEMRDDEGRPLGLVHRDVSPQNILVGIDGIARLTDFGLAKCVDVGEQPTTEGTLKGKLSYMAPEYLRGKKTDRRFDVFAMGVVLWEALTGQRLFRGENQPNTIERILREQPRAISEVLPEVGTGHDAVVARALVKDPDARYATVDELRGALEGAAQAVGLVATAAQVGAYVRATVGPELDARRATARASLYELPRAAAPSARPPRRRIVLAASAVLAVSAMAAAPLVWRGRNEAQSEPPAIANIAAADAAPLPAPPAERAPPAPPPEAPSSSSPRVAPPATARPPRRPPRNPYAQ